jgi:hypothetical protein
MLPSIDTPNRRFAVSGLGATEGTGILSRSYEDLHPNPDAYEVVWSGTIQAEADRAEQRRPSLEPEPVQPAPPAPPKPEGRPIAETILAILMKAKQPIPRHRICAVSGFAPSVVDMAMYRLATNGLVVSDLQLNANPAPGQKKWMRVYSVPVKVAA